MQGGVRFEVWANEEGGSLWEKGDVACVVDMMMEPDNRIEKKVR